MTGSQTLPPPQGPEYARCGACGHIEPEHRPDAGPCLVCDCAAYRPAVVPTDEDFLVAVEEALESALLPSPGVAALERARDAVMGVLAPLVAELRRAAVPSAPADRAAILREAVERLRQVPFTNVLTDLRRMANEAEYVATPCSFGACEPGGEPCTTHERLMAHAEGDHELCEPDCGTSPSRMADEAQQPEAGEPAQRNIQCADAFWLRQPHAAHDWQQRPDAQPVRCQGAGGAQQPETEPCGAWGGCTLARGHNIGQADIPENHQPPAVGAQQPKEA